MPQVGSIVTVFVSGRHDFKREARVLAVEGGNLKVRYLNYNLPDEWIPARWL